MGLKTDIYNAFKDSVGGDSDNIDTLAMEADKVWFRYLMDNNVAIFGFPLEMWMTREKKIII